MTKRDPLEIIIGSLLVVLILITIFLGCLMVDTAIGTAYLVSGQVLLKSCTPTNTLVIEDDGVAHPYQVGESFYSVTKEGEYIKMNCKKGVVFGEISCVGAIVTQ